VGQTNLCMPEMGAEPSTRPGTPRLELSSVSRPDTTKEQIKMKSTRLVRLGRVTAALLAVFALGAVAVASAQAAPTEGPFWTVNGHRLKANETREVTGKVYEGTKNPLKLEATLLGITAKVECELAKAAPGSYLAGGAPATSREISEFSDCTVTNNGEGCKAKEPIKTEPIRSELVYNDEEKTVGEKILVEADPEAGTEAKYVTLHFEGAKCLVDETEIGKGLALGEAFTDPTVDGGKEEQVTLKTTPVEQTSALIKAPDAERSVYLLKGTTLELVEIKPFKAFGNEAKITGTVLVLLTSGEKFGVES
jgi:hypothetical protein